MGVSFLVLFALMGGGMLLIGRPRNIRIGLLLAILAIFGLSWFFIPGSLTDHTAVEVQQAVPGFRQEGAVTLETPKVVSQDPPAPSEDAATQPMWSNGIDDQFEANVYPSMSAATGALGRRIVRTIRGALSDPNESVKIVLFDTGVRHDLTADLKQAIERQMPGVPCSIETSGRAVDGNEVAVDLRRTSVVGNSRGSSTGRRGATPGWRPQGAMVQSGSVGASLWIKGQRRDIVEIRFRDAPWLDDFGSFARENPWQRYVVAHSSEACTTEAEARQQASQDARGRVLKAFRTKFGSQPNLGVSVSSSDVQVGRFIVDQFLQSFDGSAGKIWRQAILLDTSDSKLQWLNYRSPPTPVARASPPAWVRQIGSAFGVLLLILVIYFFLNLATRRYHGQS
jgi:hypothetical protein